MPAKRNYKKRKNPRYNRRQWKPKMSMALRPDYSTIAYTGDQVISSTNLLEYTNSITFQFAQITNYTYYAQLWDQYRINYVKVEFIPTMATVVNRPYDDTTTPNINTVTPLLFAVIDRDDSNTQNSLEIKARQGHRFCKATQHMKWSFSPSTLTPVYAGSVSSFGYKVNLNKQWLDMGNTGVVHFGLKYALETQSPNGTYSYRIRKTFYISLRKRLN